MKVSIEQFLRDSGVVEPFYPGKRLVKQCRQPGEYKSHCVVYDWRNPEEIKVEVKPGLSGRTLAVENIKHYPVSFQSPTFVVIEVNDNDKKSKKDEDEDGDARSGKSGSGDSKGFKKKKLSEMGGMMAEAFGDIAEGKIPDGATIKEMVVMGMAIAAEAYEAVLSEFKHQVQHGKIAATDILAKAGNFITKYTPPSFMKPSGNEDATYKYDRDKNYDIGLKTPSLG